MKPRTLIILAVAVIGLLAVSMIQKASHRRTVAQSDTAAVLDVAVDIDTVNRVTISRGGDDGTRVVLERLPDRWVVRSAWSHPAEERKVTELIEALDGLRGDFRSSSAEVLADYGLGPDADPVTITLYGEEWQETAALEFGEQSDRGGSFVREAGGDAVFLCRTNVLGKLGMWSGPADPENRHFLDLAVHSCEAADIASIRLHTAGEPSLVMEKVYAVADTTGAEDRSSWEWVLTEPERRPLAKSKVDAIANGLTNVTAVDVDDPKAPWEDYGLWQAHKRIEAVMADGSVFELRFGDARGDDDGRQAGYWTMASTSPAVWLVRDFKVDQLSKALEDLLPEE